MEEQISYQGAKRRMKPDNGPGGLEMTQHLFTRWISNLIIVAILALIMASVAPAKAALSVQTSTGIQAVIHTPEEIIERYLDADSDGTWLRHPVAGSVELDTTEHPWDSLVPVSSDVVMAALESMDHFQANLQVEIFLLPGMPADVMSSFARRDAIFMAPTLAEPADETIHYIVTHEMGHVLCWFALDGQVSRWSQYCSLRGLDLDQDGAQVSHAQRNREIIAEDFRFLFGGHLATASGTIENGDLVLPNQVHGLQELLVSYLATPQETVLVEQPSRVYPNPCRAQARVELTLASSADKSMGAEPILEVYNLRGQLVKRIQGGTVVNGRAVIEWDGQGQDGRRVSAGMYLYRVSAGPTKGSGRMVILN